MSDLFQLALNETFLLFMLSIFGLDIARYIQQKVSQCNPNVFGFVLITLLYWMIVNLVP